MSSWKTETSLARGKPVEKLITIGDSIWCFTQYGVTEYCTQTNKRKQLLKYPQVIDKDPWLWPRLSFLFKSMIYIIFGTDKGPIYEFNPNTNEFIKKQDMNPVGAGLSCVVVNDKVHIFNHWKKSNHII